MKKKRRQIYYNIKTGTFNEWRWYVVYVVIVLVICFSSMSEANQCYFYKKAGVLSWGDYLIKIFAGMRDFTNCSRKESFLIPKEWLFVQFYYLFLISNYPRKDLEQTGYQSIIKGKSKKSWWYSKCTWILFTTLIYYFILDFVTFMFSLFTGTLVWNLKRDVWKIGVSAFSNGDFVIAVFLLPVIISACIGMAELILLYFCRPIIAVFIIIGYMVMSAYWCNPFLIGNYNMLLRNQIIIGDLGVKMEWGILMGIIFSLFFAVIGARLFQKKEWTNKEMF